MTFLCALIFVFCTLWLLELSLKQSTKYKGPNQEPELLLLAPSLDLSLNFDTRIVSPKKS